MPRYLVRDWTALGTALVAPLVVAVLLAPLRSALATTSAALVLVVVVVAVAALGNRVAGALAAVSAAAWFDFFFTPPYHQFAIVDPADIQTAVLMLLVGLTVSQLASHARRLKVITVTDAGYLSQLHQTADLAGSARAPNSVVDHVKAQLTDLLELQGARFEYGSLLGHPPRLLPDGAVVGGHRRWDADQGLPQEEIELRAYGNGRYHGRFLLHPKPGSAPPLQARLVAITLADLTGAALDRGDDIAHQ